MAQSRATAARAVTAGPVIAGFLGTVADWKMVREVEISDLPPTDRNWSRYTESRSYSYNGHNGHMDTGSMVTDTGTDTDTQTRAHRHGQGRRH